MLEDDLGVRSDASIPFDDELLRQAPGGAIVQTPLRRPWLVAHELAVVARERPAFAVLLVLINAFAQETAVDLELALDRARLAVFEDAVLARFQIRIMGI